MELSILIAKPCAILQTKMRSLLATDERVATLVEVSNPQDSRSIFAAVQQILLLSIRC